MRVCVCERVVRAWSCALVCRGTALIQAEPQPALPSNCTPFWPLLFLPLFQDLLCSFLSNYESKQVLCNKPYTTEVYKGMREPPLLLGPPVPSSKELSPGPKVRNAAPAEGAQNHARESDGVDSLTEPSSPPSRAVRVLRQAAEPCSPSTRNGHIRPQQEPIRPCEGWPVMVRDGAVNCAPRPLLLLIKEKQVYSRPFLERAVKEERIPSQASRRVKGVSILPGSKLETRASSAQPAAA